MIYCRTTFNILSQENQDRQIQIPDWMISDDEEDEAQPYGINWEDNSKHPKNHVEADMVKLGNLIKRRKVYGDITQNATESQITRLLVSNIYFRNFLRICLILYGHEW